MLLSGLLFNVPMFLTNAWYSGYLPFNSNKLYDRHARRFKVSKIVDERGNLDVEKYHTFGVKSSTDFAHFVFSRFTQRGATR